MGTTLTGTTPQDTYDSLIKVTDNGPLSGTAKYLSDGLGNDSVLALSTSRVGIGTATPSFETEILLAANPRLGITATNSTGVPELYLRRNATTIVGYLGAGVNSDLSNVGDFVVLENRLSTGGVGIRSNGATGLILTSAGNVGIGATSPAQKLHVEGSIALAYGSSLHAANATYTKLIETGYNGSSDFVSLYTAGNNAANATAKITMLAAGNVGIGTSAPAVPLDVVGNIRSSTGILFGSDTAAANLLDDYEEGTFTMTATPADSGTITLNPSNNTARYTKIGRQVTIQAFVTISAVSSPVGSSIILGGLPFTIANTNAAAGSGSVAWADASASYVRSVLPAIFFANTTLLYASINASTLASPDELFINMTYTV